MIAEFLPLGMFAVLLVFLLTGYPVAFALAGTGLLFIVIGSDWLPSLGVALPWEPSFRLARLNILPQRLYSSVMDNYTLVAVPFFIFMGTMLERSGLAEDLLQTMGRLFGRLRGGLAISVVLVGMLLAAATGVVGASVVTMGVLALPVMLKYGYDTRLATGTIAASGTLGQIIPPSIVLIILGDQMGVNVGDLFLGAMGPGILLGIAYMVWVSLVAWRRPLAAPALPPGAEDVGTTGPLLGAVVRCLLPPLGLVAAVLGTIFFGIATPTEAGAMGALGATLLALAYGKLNMTNLMAVAETTVRLTAMVFTILVGATVFATVFSAMGGKWLVEDFLMALPGETAGFVLFVMLTIFLLGFFLDFIEITFIVVPLVAPMASAFGLDPIWFGVLIAMNLQASFLTPPFGFSLFYLRGVTPPAIPTGAIYRGIVPYIIIQLLMLGLIIAVPEIVTWLPSLSAN
ncbi:MAG: TRAP transporter large permease subunit [Spiribacter salinus]|uniref:TRAP transporter large permease protein n=1 Tax=Spiribacter salinus TaxID=1335746 RepID=A0A540VV81_9GAMM|nr:TRAP transporter large permease subunit [Spiribacter sp.]MDR9455455.1 TRAP transporter large permease subunit [Spiribacter sp.]TQF00669.1 MAG: TRAP transporter large permease subunit [Spiribacter salinus]